MRNKHLYLLITLLALLAAGPGARATTKTVTYTITQIESGTTNMVVTFTRSGDDPFDASATTYTCTVPSNSLSTSGGAGQFYLTMADGFTFSGSWGSGSSVAFVGNYLCIMASDKKFKFSLRCEGYYYVTNVQLTGREGTWSNTNFDSLWNFSQTYNTAFSFGALTVTYSDTPALSIFESDGENAYKINDKHDLRHLANYVNNGGGACLGLTFRQTQDITCDNTYTPIGGYFNGTNSSFSGIYDGKGHTISGITVTRTDDTSADGCIGLFGHTSFGTVENVILASSTITGHENVGGIVGETSGTIRNCRVESSVTIKAGHNYAHYHGGIVGYMKGEAKVIGCVSAASVSRNDKLYCRHYGGIVGYKNNGTIQDCLYTGSTVTANDYYGTIVGHDEAGTLLNNYNRGSLGGVGTVGGDPSDRDGARRARTVTLGEHVALVGDETAYDVSGLTAIGFGNYALRRGNTLYSGEGQVLTPGYAGTLPLGYNVGFSYNDGSDHTLTDNTFTMPAANVTVTATLVACEAPLALVQGTKDGVSAWWGTFYASTECYSLSEGAAAYTMDAGHHLYRLGDDGRFIPAGTAVVIVSATPDVSVLPAGTASAEDHAPGGNILIGVDEATSFSSIYALSVNATGEVGFYKFKEVSLPGHKAGYPTDAEGGVQNYDRQANQEW